MNVCYRSNRGSGPYYNGNMFSAAKNRKNCFFCSPALWDDLSFRMRTGSTTIADASGIENAFDKKVLIIDDVKLICRVVSKQLQSAGFHRNQYLTDPLRAIEKINEFQPDLILLDIYMPAMSGLELLKQIRSKPEYNSIIVLMLSGAGQNDQSQSLELGASGFLQKPLTPETLAQTITSKFSIAQRPAIQ